MKKIIYSILFLSSIAFAQTEKTVGDFNKVTSFDQIDVLLIPGTENKVILQGANSEEVELVNNNCELKIRLPLGKLLKGDDISATVYYKNLDTDFQTIKMEQMGLTDSGEPLHIVTFSVDKIFDFKRSKSY